MRILAPTLFAAVLSAVACYILARISGRLRLQTQPRADRWSRSATPNTGGVAILLASATCFLLFAPSGFERLALCATGIAALGFVDDRLELPPLAKLVGQIVLAGFLVTSGAAFSVSPWGIVNTALTLFWIVGITNAFNLIDNMDGLCSGVAILVATSGVVLALLRGDGERALLLSVLAGACAGFLLLNRKPARIFLGDCGSMFVGFTLAALAVAPARLAISVADSVYALPAFLYPLFDTALVTCLRRRAGRPISVGGLDHSSHRLVAAGMTERNAVRLLWVIALVCAACGPLSYAHPAYLALSFAGLIAAFTLFGGFLARVSAGVLREAAPAKLSLTMADARRTKNVTAQHGAQV